jgi:hypothetical protein
MHLSIGANAMSNNTEYNLGFDDGLALGKSEAEALRAEVERLSYDGIHTCHDDCPRLPCVQRREIERLREALEWAAGAYERYLNTSPGVAAYALAKSAEDARAALSKPMP